MKMASMDDKLKDNFLHTLIVRKSNNLTIMHYV